MSTSNDAQYNRQLSKRRRRYRQQPWYIRYCCWLRWKPWYAGWALSVIGTWLLTGAKIPEEERPWICTRRAYIGHIWMLARSTASAAMNDVVTTEELKREVTP